MLMLYRRLPTVSTPRRTNTTKLELKEILSKSKWENIGTWIEMDGKFKTV